MNTLLDKAAPILDSSEYPQRWQDYIGQEQAKKQLRVAAKSARIRKSAMDHVLIAHPSPGIGKTALAVLLAKELGTTVRVASGQMTKDKARLVLSGMNDRDVLFYDEFHQVMDSGRRNAEWLLSFLQDGVISGPLGPEPQPKVTVVAATTDAHKIPDNIVSRFITPTMVDHTTEGAAKIVTLTAAKLLGPDMPKITKADATTLAHACHKNPRAIRNMLIVLRDMLVTDELAVKNGRYDIEGLLEFQGITQDGLDQTAQKYLRALALEFNGTAGAKALEERLQQPGGLGNVERMLMDRGFIARTKTGRTLTQAGILRWRELETEKVAS